MIIKKTHSQINFGWKGVTHQAVSQAAINKVNKELGNSAIFDVQQITLLCTLPDNEKHPPHSHSADITSLKEGDAYYMFHQYDRSIKSKLANKDKERLNELIARAFHSLQDMTDPAHARDYLEVKQTRLDQSIHLKIENDAIKHQKFAINYAKNNIDSSFADFETFLILKMQESKQSYNDIKQLISKRKNQTNSAKIEALEIKSIISTFNLTYKYLKELIKYL